MYLKNLKITCSLKSKVIGKNKYKHFPKISKGKARKYLNIFSKHSES